MRLTALQLPARFDAKAEQLAYTELLLEGGPATDLVLLPEASLTGYVSAQQDFDLTRFAEPLLGETHASLHHLAGRFDCLVVGPLIERDGDACFNALIGVSPLGETVLHYRKHHPWFPEVWATPGASAGTVVTWRGVKLLPAICFDGHFLSEDAGLQLDGADVLLFASAWVDDAGDSLPPLLSALATQHHLAVLNANWGPGRPLLPGQGGSMFIDAKGQLTARLKGAPGRLDVVLDSRSTRKSG
jgi:5-aminopentanamidase